MTTLEKFNATYEVIRMSRNSMVLRNRETNNMVFIHRKAYNSLLSNQCENFREIDRKFTHDGRDYQTSKWVEVLTWVSI